MQHTCDGTSCAVLTEKLRKQQVINKENQSELLITQTKYVDLLKRHEELTLAWANNDKGEETSIIIKPIDRTGIPTSNMFSPLSDDDIDIVDVDEGANWNVASRHQKRNKRYFGKNKRKGQKQNSPKNAGQKTRQLFVFGDSHAKDLSGRLQQTIPFDTEVFVNANSGAPLTHVLKNCDAALEQLGPEDTVVIIAGANDICDVTPRNRSRPANVLPGKVARFVENHLGRNIIVVSFFHRHDLSQGCLINRDTRRVNKELANVVKIGATIVDTRQLHRGHYTRHGQHLNGSGKNALCRMIVEVVRMMSTRKPEVDKSRTRLTIPPPTEQLGNTEENTIIKTPGRPCVSVDGPCRRGITAAKPVVEMASTPLVTPVHHKMSAQPVCLPYDSYADAVKISSLPTSPAQSGSSQQNDDTSPHLTYNTWDTSDHFLTQDLVLRPNQ